MAKHVLVLGGMSSEARSEELLAETTRYLQVLSDAAGLDAHYQYGFFDGLEYTVSEEGVHIADTKADGQPLEQYDLVLLRVKVAPYRAFAQIVSDYLAAHGIPCVNNDFAGLPPSGKLAQMIVFQQAGIRVPETIFAGSARLLDLAPARLGFPMIVKGIHAAKGRDNHLVRSKDELRTLLAAPNAPQYIAQAYIPNDCDYRLLIIGDGFLIIRRRRTNGSHLNNISTGGHAELVPADTFPDKLLLQCRTAAERAGLLWAGVDFIYDSGKEQAYILEVNSLPQLDSGAFKDEKAGLLADFLQTILSGARPTGPAD